MSYCIIYCIASTQPHAAFAALIHGLSSKWTYLCHTMPDRCTQFSLQSELIHDLFTLPAKTKQRSTSEADDLAALLPDDLKKAMSLARKKVASVWLTALPLQEYGFTLHKGTFHDAIALWCGWTPPRMPTCACEESLQWNMLFHVPKADFLPSGTMRPGT